MDVTLGIYIHRYVIGSAGYDFAKPRLNIDSHLLKLFFKNEVFIVN